MSKTHAELLGCPFCGSQTDIDFDYRDHFEPKEDELDYWVYCTGEPKCIIHRTNSYPTEQEAIKVWNTRVNKEAEFLEELKDFVQRKREESSARTDEDWFKGQSLAFDLIKDKIEQFLADTKDENSK